MQSLTHSKQDATLSERAVTGLLLSAHERTFPACLQSSLTTASFTDETCVRAWRTMEKLRAKKPGIVTLDLVAENWGGDPEDALVELGPLVESAPIPEYAVHYAERVREAQLQRELRLAVQAAIEQLDGGQERMSVARRLQQIIESTEGATKGGLDIMSATDFVAAARPEPVQVVHDVLRAGQIGILSASVKAGKTWSLMAAGFAVATGGRWFGWNATQGRVLYLNAELPDYDLDSRLKALADRLGLDGLPEGLDVWHLRGQTMSIPQLIPAIMRRQKKHGPYALIMPDPLYRFGQGRDENDNAAQSLTMGELGELAERTSAAVLAAHHFSKGNKSATDHLDRASGAGMFARAPDTILTLTAHEESDCYTLETTCRSFPKPDPIVVRWDYPLWVVADELDPEQLKRPMGRPARFSADDLLELLPASGLSHGEWLEKAKRETGMGKTRFNELMRVAKSKGLVVSAFGKYNRRGEA